MAEPKYQSELGEKALPLMRKNLENMGYTVSGDNALHGKMEWEKEHGGLTPETIQERKKFIWDVYGATKAAYDTVKEKYPEYSKLVDQAEKNLKEEYSKDPELKELQEAASKGSKLQSAVQNLKSSGIAATAVFQGQPSAKSPGTPA